MAELELRPPADEHLEDAASLLAERRRRRLALTAHVLTWAREHGFDPMTTDWRMVNLLSSRFWPCRGFRPTFVRLYGSIP